MCGRSGRCNMLRVVLRVRLAGLGLAFLLVMSGAGAAQAQQFAPATGSARQPNRNRSRRRCRAAPHRAAEPAAPPADSRRRPSLPRRRLGRSAPAGPLPVRVVPTPKSEEQLAAERQEREQRPSLQHQSADLRGAAGRGRCFSGSSPSRCRLLPLASALRAMRQPVRAGRAQRDDRAARLRLRRRARLERRPAATSGSARHGRTPARRRRATPHQHQLEGLARRAAGRLRVNYVRPPEQLFLGPAAKAEFGAMLIPMRDIQAAIEERLHLYFWGRATYEDMFEGASRISSSSAIALEVTGATPGNIALRFTPLRRAQPLRRGQPAAATDTLVLASRLEERPQQRRGCGFADAAIDLRPVMAGRRLRRSARRCRPRRPWDRARRSRAAGCARTRSPPRTSRRARASHRGRSR